MNSQPTGAELITAERQRQMEKEGYTPAADTRYERGQLIEAGCAYATNALKAVRKGESIYPFQYPAHVWPWAPEYFKPGTAVGDLVKAGALLAAEIDRLQGLAAEK